MRDQYLSFLIIDGNFEIRDIYKIDQFSNDIEIVAYGRWNRAHGISISEENIWIRRSNMKGHELRYVKYPLIKKYAMNAYVDKNGFIGISATDYHLHHNFNFYV